MSKAPTPEPFDTELFLQDLQGDSATLVHAPWGRVGLVLSGDALRCFQAFCPHMDGPLFEGSLARDELVCPWHGWRFCLRDGSRVDKAGPSLTVFRAFADSQGRVWIETPPAGTKLP